MSPPNDKPVKRPWARTAEEIARELDVDPATGLDVEQAERRRRRWGRNELRGTRRATVGELLLRQFRSPIVALLTVAAVVSFLFGEWVEGAAIVAVLVLNALLGFVAELRAVRSMEALRRLGQVRTRVRRGGDVQEVDAVELVPGDVVVLEGGDVVTADLRLFEASKLQADESTLTGESVPVSKAMDGVDVETPLDDRTSMLFKGTSVTRGAAEGIVVATGVSTEVGRIAALAEAAEEEVTPLERRLARLGGRLIWVTLGIAAFAAVSGIVAGRELFLMIETGIALAVAAIPEGLPIVATIALARGMWHMAQRNAVVNRLSAVETLGSTNVVFVDKTGTLTENRMTVKHLVLGSGSVEVGGEGLDTRGGFHRDGAALDPREEPALQAALEVGVLCNNAALTRTGGTLEASGDPLEVALLVAGGKAGIERQGLVEESPELREEAFDPSVKMMATFHEEDGRYRVAVKGAAEAVLEAADAVLTGDGERPLDDEERRRWLQRNREMAEGGLRVLAVAEKRCDSLDAAPYGGLTLIGLVGLLDPPRREVRDALAACRRAGIRVVMVTGDQPETARNIAEAVGFAEQGRSDAGGDDAVMLGNEIGDVGELDEARRRKLLGTDLFARVDPAQKLDLIAIHQAAGSVVAMTGDGVNDAPALRKADIGVAMGRRGTQVARQAADMVLTDDAFSSIVAAVHQGRVIFDNIRKFVLYLLSCNVSEIMIVTGATMVNAPLPILPLQILFLNLVTDVFPALALAMGRGDPEIMERPPRQRDEPVLTRPHWWSIAGHGALLTAAVLASLYLAMEWLGFRESRAVTVSFLTLASAQLFHVFNMRGGSSRFLDNEVTRNAWVWGALLLCAFLVVGAVYVPGVSALLDTVGPGLRGWGLIVGMSLIPWAAGQTWLAVRRSRSP